VFRFSSKSWPNDGAGMKRHPRIAALFCAFSEIAPGASTAKTASANVESLHIATAVDVSWGHTIQWIYRVRPPRISVFSAPAKLKTPRE
jgi:hypothetical protein